MRFLLALAFLGLLATSAHAQQAVNLNCQNAAGVYKPASPSNPCAVFGGPAAAPTTDASATIQTGGTFQQIAASSTTRKSLEFTNVCGVAANCTATSNNCWVYFGAFASATKANSIQIVAGDSYLRSTGTIPSDALAATCDGTGDHYALKVQ